MGYTHYFTPQSVKVRGEVAPIRHFADWAEDCQKLCIAAKEQGVEVQFELDDDKPAIFNDKGVRFNGIGDDGHETFMLLSTDVDFQFCKTARKPYDLLVTACLVAAKYRFGRHIEIGSDGNLKEWAKGIKLCQETLGGKYVTGFGKDWD